MTTLVARISVILVVLLVTSPRCPGLDLDALEKRFSEANAKLDAGDHAGAIELYNTILEAEPKAGNVWINRAVAKWNLRDASGARADLAQAISLDARNLEAYRVRASIRFQVQDFAGSLDDLNRALAIDHEDAELHGMRGETYRALDDSEAALRDLSRALKLDPDYHAARYTRALVYEGLSRPHEALADYDIVLANIPNHADALNNRGWIRFHRLDWVGAGADARKAITLAPQAAILQRLSGYSAFGAGQYQEAADALTRAAELSKDDPEQSAFALFVRHFALVRLNQADKRLATSWGAWTDEWIKGLARFIVGQLDEDGLEKLVAAASDDDELQGRACEAHFYVGLVRLQAGDRSTARLRFQSAVKTEKTSFIEHALAQAELQRLK